MRRRHSASVLAALVVMTGACPATGYAANPEQSAGRAIYEAHCASCHGRRGEGAPDWQQKDERGELPAPPHDPSGHTWKHGDGLLYRIIRNGWRDPFNKTTRQTMPAYAGTLAPREIRAVIEHLKTLWTDEQRRFQAEESRKMPYPPEAR